MMPLPGARRAAEDFAVLVDGHGAPGSDGLPADRQGLVQVVEVLRRAGTDDASLPRPEFAAGLRGRLLAEAADALAPADPTLTLPRRSSGPRERRWAVAAAVLVVLGGTTGIATAARSALPGEALYPVKRGIEHAEVRFSGSSADRGRDLLAQAGDRLQETRDLVAAGGASTPHVPGTLEDFTAQARQGSTLLLDVYRASGDAAAVASVRRFTARSLTGLGPLSGTVPASSRPALLGAVVALREIDARAVGLCPSCSDLPTLAVPEQLLVSAEADRALSDVDGAALGRGVLDNSHPVVVPRSAAAELARQLAAARAAGRQPGATTSGGSGTAPAPLRPPTAPASPGGSAAGTGTTPPVGRPTSLPALPVPSVPSVLPTQLPGSGAGTGLGTGLGDGVGDVVSTLLPDPSAGLLP
jgi:hypothetical protein